MYFGRLQHDVRIGRTVVHSGRKSGHAGPLERIAGFRMFLHPPAEIQYGGLAGSEIDERVSFQYQQDIQIVRKFPVHPVCADVRRHVGGIYQKDHIRGSPCTCPSAPCSHSIPPRVRQDSPRNCSRSSVYCCRSSVFRAPRCSWHICRRTAGRTRW